MNARVKLNEYIWLIRTVQQMKKISFVEINQRWSTASVYDGKPLARTSFFRTRQYVADLFGVKIECDLRDHKYYISNDFRVDNDDIRSWMHSTLQVSFVLNESLALKDRIILEKVPVSGGLLGTMLDAMRQNRLVDIDYHKYGALKARHYLIEPYALKIYSGRWYVLGKLRMKAGGGKAAGERLSIFAFDRIKDFFLTDEMFRIDPLFNASDYFKYSFGVYIGDEEPQRVVLRFFDHQRDYVRDLPLHQSQRLVGEGDNWTDYAYHIRITNDFIAEIMKRCDFVKVVEPASLARTVKERLMKGVMNQE